MQDSIAQTANNIQSSIIKPLRIVNKGHDHYFIDFGKDAFGVLLFNFKEIQSDSLVISMGEKLTDEFTVDKNPGGTIRFKRAALKPSLANKTIQLPLPADGRNDKYPAVLVPDSIGRIMPFRYVEIENLQIPLSQIEIQQKNFHYKFNDEASAFCCSDTVLNQIWELCKYTIKATSFCGKYIDGDRERIPYEADAFINQLSHYAVDNEYSLAKQTNEYFIDHPTWPTEWILHTVFLFYYDYLYTGDTTLIAKHYDRLKYKTLNSLAREDGLISSSSPKMTAEVINQIGFNRNYTGRPIEDIVDWPKDERDGYEMVQVNTVVNSFYYNNLKLMSEIANVLQKKDDAMYFQKEAELVKRAINKKLFNPQSGVYIDGEGSTHASLHANMFPLAFGIVPESKKVKVVSFIKSRGMACSVYGAQYLLEALYMAGEADAAMNLMTTTEGDRNWWNMIRLGSTMTLEAWDMKYKPNLDWNHAWATAPSNIISRYLWGIMPTEAGFEKVVIKPQMSNLTNSKIKVPTIKGTIYAEYNKEGKTIDYQIELPQGMSGEFKISNYIRAEITFEGKTSAIKKGRLSLHEGINTIKIVK